MWASLDQYIFYFLRFDPLSTNFTKWSNTLKQFEGKIGDELFESVWPFCGIDA